ncbi:MobF family relaxase [Gordonia sp. N1V]|uniref:MobF family relaxase n=1 Tax=Gordonia sp. N1V TaxID=3034163 RepID=UPI0023E2913A|nr:MobF family relaxase [Gordonia sp. N1V]MDF3285020.1 MobF family relaxase [Gordonia sp. N1V]
MMSLHKLTAGDGYEYLTRQVAAHDGTELGRDSLESYYSAKGEAPGRWLGSGLVAFDDINAGDVVSSAQMKALWGEGRHPNATAIEAALIAEGHGAQYATAATRLGTPFKVYEGANDFVKAVAQAFAEHNTARGEKANAPIDAEARAQIRTRVATSMFATEFGRAPADHRELSGWIAQKTRQKTTAVAGYDLTFSPVKSVSALWAVAAREVAQRIETAHQRAVENTLASIERDIAYTRLGANGVARWKAHGLIAAAFTHRDSRAGDPDLHTHVPISNKVRFTGPDGIDRWGALDGKPLHRLAVQASEEYNTRLEAEILAEFPGAQFVDKDPGLRGKRPIRELDGISAELIDRWSARTRAIEDTTKMLVDRFQAEHGREPTAVEHIALRQQANLATREAKHEPRSLAEQRAQWHAEALTVLGGEPGLAAMISAGLGVADAALPPQLRTEIRRMEGQWRYTLSDHAFAAMAEDRAKVRELAAASLAEHGPRQPHHLDADTLANYSMRLVDRVSLTRSVWQPHHLHAEALRACRVLGVSGEHVSGLAAHLTAAALEHCLLVTDPRRDGDRNEPRLLRGPDGASVFTDPGLATYTSPEVLAAERRIVAAAGLSDGHRIDPLHVDLALLEHEANKYPLNAGQQALVREFATAGARFHLALAPAGTGKTSAMAAFTTAWTNAGGTVIGLAPTANAAQVLAKDIGGHADTLDKYAHLVAQLAAAGNDTERHRILQEAPDWFRRIGPGTVILIDEIGMSSTASLDPVIAHALAAGADVKGVGDDQQLASVAAGGVLRDVAALGNTLTLSEVMRFTDPAEGAASLAVRDGREEAIGYYIDHQRVHVTADTVAADLAYQAWRRDTAAGHASVMLAPTLDTVRELNARARADRLADHPLSPTDLAHGLGREVTLADGLPASAGDTIRTRRNDRRLRLSGTDFVRNGYRWTITAVGADGSLTVTHDKTNATLTLPADYVAADCELGYAATIHAAQGMTVGSRGKHQGTAHIVGSDRLDKQLLYVAMTRATDGNHLYLGTSEADPHKIIYDRALRPPTAVDMLRTIITRDGAQTSATTTARDDTNPHQRIAATTQAYHYAIGALAEHLLGPATMTAIDAGAEHLLPGLTDENAWPVLRQHLATLALDTTALDTTAPAGPDSSHTPSQRVAERALTALSAAIDSRELDTAAERAAVLDWRLDTTGGHSAGRGPLPWLPAIPESLAGHPDYGTYLAGRAHLVGDLAEQIRAEAHTWTAATAPRWARPLVIADGDHRELLGDIAVFRAAHHVDDRDRRPTGPDQYALTPARHQQRLTEAFTAAIGGDDGHLARWHDLATRIDPHLLGDPFWPDLAERLTLAARAGLDVHTLLTDAAAHRALPTELPAAALWWRVAEDLGPAVLDTTDSHIQATWTPQLAGIVGDDLAEIIVTDPAWPALVTAVNAADPRDWTPATILDVAHQLLLHGTDGELRPADVTQALAWRVELLATDHALSRSIPLPEHSPLSIEDEEAAPPDPDTTTAPSEVVDVADEQLPAVLDDTTPHEAVEGYWAALTDDGPPPEYADTHDHEYDDLGALDFDDLATERPPLVLDTPVDDTELDELRAAAAAAHADADALHAIILDPTRDGPAVTAATDHLTELRTLADRHRPALAALSRAHHTWVDADLAAEAAADTLARITTRLDALRAADNPDPDHLARLTGERELAELRATDARHRADHAADQVLAASTALTELAPTGTITNDDVDRARLAAERIDLEHLADLRHRATRLDGRVFRAEHTAARRHAAERSLPRPTPTTDTPHDSAEVEAENRSTTATLAPERPVLAEVEEASAAPSRSAVEQCADRYRHARAALRTETLRRAAAAVFASAAVDTLTHSPGADDLAAQLERARAAGFAPADVLDTVLSSATAPITSAADLTSLVQPYLDEQVLTATRRFEHAAPGRWEEFTAVDRSSPEWADLVETIRRHELHTGINPDIVVRWLELNTHPDTATAGELVDTLHRRYPADTTPVTTTDWLPGVPLGAEHDHPDQTAHFRAARDELAHTLVTPTSTTTGHQPWHDHLPAHLDTDDRARAINDITAYRELAGIDDTDPRPLGPFTTTGDELTDTHNRHLTRQHFTPPPTPPDIERPRPPRPTPPPAPTPETGPHHGPRI